MIVGNGGTEIWGGQHVDCGGSNSSSSGRLVVVVVVVMVGNM